MPIDAIDHIVLTVSDVDATCDFYTRVLGLQVATFEDGRRAIVFGSQKINLHQTGKEFEPKAVLPTPGSGDICFRTTESLATVEQQLRTQGVAILEGPVPRTGAMGQMTSIYLRDPDGNLIEIARYPD